MKSSIFFARMARTEVYFSTISYAFFGTDVYVVVD